MIYTVTLNPSIDYSMHPAKFCDGSINRSEYETYTCGGKGINVSVMLANLGAESTALGFTGGFAGKEIERLAKRSGVKCDFCEIRDCSRINLKILSDKESAVNAKGPFILIEEEKALVDKLSRLSEDDIVIISGSAPESESERLLENVLDAAAHTRLIADMEGEALRKALERKPYLIKPNHEELLGFFGKKEMDEAEIVSSAGKLRGLGAENVLLSLGESGAMLFGDDDKIYRIRAPKIEVKSTVGAGDSLLAGFVAGSGQGKEFALALAVSAGSATAANEKIAEYEDVMNVFSMM